MMRLCLARCVCMCVCMCVCVCVCCVRGTFVRNDSHILNSKARASLILCTYCLKGWAHLCLVPRDLCVPVHGQCVCMSVSVPVPFFYLACTCFYLAGQGMCMDRVCAAYCFGCHTSKKIVHHLSKNRTQDKRRVRCTANMLTSTRTHNS